MSTLVKRYFTYADHDSRGTLFVAKKEEKGEDRRTRLGAFFARRRDG
jgi:hypothetical protein